MGIPIPGAIAAPAMLPVACPTWVGETDAQPVTVRIPKMMAIRMF